MRSSSWLTGFVVAAAAASGVACSEPSSLPPGRLGCLASGCHAKVEHIHYGGAALDCVDCHGGNRTATTIGEAHVTTTVSFNASSPGGQREGTILTGASLRELDEVDPAVMQFLNPADYRVVERTCGSATRGGGNCHTRVVRNSLLSTHATLAGQLAGGLYFGGLTDRTARFAVRDTTDPFPLAQQGFVSSLGALPGSDDGMTPSGDVARDYYTSMGQLCVECHLSRNGSMAPGKYTSSGCNACHMVTDDDGRVATADSTQNVDEGGHPALHRLTNLIPDAQCNHCHHAHLHRGLLSQGVRERSEPPGDEEIGGPNRGVPDPPNAVFWSQDHYVRYQGAYNLYGKPYPFYISDEDGTNDVDETPPDIHTERGMGCIDCHTAVELHGDGHLAERRELETRVRCQTCHGDPAMPVDVASLPFNRSLSRVGGNADNPSAIAADPTGQLFQLGKLDEQMHHVTQISERVDPTQARFNPRTLMGCGLHAGTPEFRAQLLERFRSTPRADVAATFPGMPEGGTLPDDLGMRAGRMECFSCHNAWTVNCYGCHVVRDDRSMATNQMTGIAEPGRISNLAMSVVADALALGFNTRDRISPMVGTSIFFTHIGADGTPIIDAAPLRTVDGFSGDANQHNPVHHHTVRRVPRDCQGCHPRADVPGDENALKRAIGFGTGQYVFVDGTGRRHILDRLVAIDFDGDGVPDDPETTSLRMSAAAVMPVAASTHISITDDPSGAGPSPLDRATINRMLGNPVVPQRP